MKFKITLYGILVSVILMLSCSKEKEMDIYLLIGQSNMAGRATILPAYADTLQGVYLFTGDSAEPWVPACNPLNRFSSIRKDLSMQALGPGYSFAKAMRAADPEQEIGLVVNARGGTSIREWLPGTPYYEEAVTRTHLASKDGRLKGILWHQGSSDVKRTEEYIAELDQLINALRIEFRNSQLPFIAGELSEDKPQRKVFNTMIRGLPDRVPFTAVVSAEGIRTTDSTHFDTPGQIQLGQRYAREMINMATIR